MELYVHMLAKCVDEPKTWQSFFTFDFIYLLRLMANVSGRQLPWKSLALEGIVREPGIVGPET